MIPAVAQTLAEILAGGTSLISTEQIDFKHPGMQQDIKPALNLYCYDIREHNQVLHLGSQYTQDNSQLTAVHGLTLWFDVSFLISAWDYTALGEQRLLSEALTLLLHHRLLPETLIAPALRGYGSLSLTVSSIGLIDAATLWKALGVPLRPALYVTVKTPFDLSSTPPSPGAAEHKVTSSFYLPSNKATNTYPVSVAGIVKNAATMQDWAATEAGTCGNRKNHYQQPGGTVFINHLPLAY